MLNLPPLRDLTNIFVETKLRAEGIVFKGVLV